MKENNRTIKMPNEESKVVCHLCGEIWKVPMWIAGQYGPDRPWECPNCRTKMRLINNLKGETHI